METTPSHPQRPIGRRQLTILLLAISLIPPLFVVSMVATHKPPPEPTLDVSVTLDVMVHKPRKSPDSPRLLPCLILKNPTDDQWRNISVSINKDFFSNRVGVLEAGESFQMPLEFFVTKGGNVAFQPGSESVHQVTVFAQIPSGARAVREIFFGSDGKETAREE